MALWGAVDEGRTSGLNDKEPFAYLDALQAGIKADAKGRDAA